MRGSAVGRREERPLRRRRRRDADIRGLEGVVTFFGSHHALRAEKLLLAGGQRAVLVPGPREISPNCGVALRFDHQFREKVEEILAAGLVQFEAIHHYPG
jgi:hypothetical protein